MDIIIRSATERDAAELCRLNTLFNEVTDVSPETIALSIRDNGQERVFVAECGNRLIGFCCTQLFKSFCYNRNSAEITELFVEESYRRKGVATELMSLAERYYSDKYIDNFRLLTGDHNISAQSFYESLGYLKTDEIMYEKEFPNRDNGSLPL